VSSRAERDRLPIGSPQGDGGGRHQQRFQVAFHGVAAAFRPAGFHFGHCFRSGAAGSVAMAVFAETHFEKRPQHLCDGLLDHPIQHRRYPQRALGPVGLRNPHPFDGRGPVTSFSDRLGDPRPFLPRERGEVLDGHAIDPRSTLVRFHAFPRLGEVLRFKDLLDHGSSLRGSMVAFGCLRCAPAPSVTAFGFASPSGVVGWSVRHGVDPLLIGSVLHRVNAPAR
jgi:hypothetical protein